MNPVLYNEQERYFVNNGIGQLVESWIAEVSETLNGELELYLEYPANGRWFDEIKEFRYILAKPNDRDDEHAFRIYDLDKDSEPGIVKVKASSRTNMLGENLIKLLSYKNTPASQIYTHINNNMVLPSPISFRTDMTTSGNVDWEYRSPLNCALGEEGSMVQVFGGEIKRFNDHIFHYKRRGRDRVTTIRQDKNLDGFNQKVNTKALVTKILPYYTYYPTPPEGFKGITEPVTITGDVVSSPKVAKYPIEVIRPIDFSGYRDDIEATKIIVKKEKLKNGKIKETKTEVIDDVVTKENFIKMSKTYFTKINPGVDVPSVQLEVDLYQLSDSPEYDKFEKLEQISVSDTVDIWVKEYGIDVTVKVQNIVYDSLSEKVRTLTAGSTHTSNYQSQKGEYTQLVDSIKQYIDSSMDNTVQMAANGSNRIWSGATKPIEGMKEGDTWFETLEGGHTAIHQYEGGEWIFILDTTDTQTNKDLIDEQKLEINKAIDAANKANKEIDDAIKDAGFGSLKDAIEKGGVDIEIGGRNLLLDSGVDFVSGGSVTWNDYKGKSWTEVE